MKLFQKNSKGFTLIELLVVIAIIAILAGMIIVAVGGARTKARETRAKAEMSSMRAQAELFYNNNGFSYGTTGAVCGDTNNLFASSTDSQNSLKRLLASVQTVVQQNNGVPDTYCVTNGSAWAVAARFSDGVFCVDSNGVAKQFSGTNPAPTPSGSITNAQCN